MQLAGLVSVRVDADTAALDQGFKTAETKTRQFDQRVSGSFKNASKSTNSWAREVVRGSASVQAANQNTVRSVNRVSGAFQSALGPVKAFALTAAAAFSVQSVLSAADAYTTFTNRLQSAGLAGQEFQMVQDRLLKSANENGASISTLGQLYGRLTLASDNLGASQDQLLQLTDGLSAAIKVSGGSAAQSSGALLQLSQALGAGVVRAEEFNSILEGTPEIARAAARGMAGIGGNVAELRNRVLEGQVTSEQFFNALLVGLQQTQATAANMSATVGGAFTSLSNSFIFFVGQLNQGIGITSIFAQVLTGIGSTLTFVGQAISFISSALQPYTEYLYAAGTALLFAFGPSALAAVSRLAVAIGTTAVAAVTRFSAVLLANPLGIFLATVGAVVSLMWQFRDSLGVVGEMIQKFADAAFAAFNKVKEVIGSIVEALGGEFPEDMNLNINGQDAADTIYAGMNKGGDVAGGTIQNAMVQGGQAAASAIGNAAASAGRAAGGAVAAGGAAAGKSVEEGAKKGGDSAGKSIKKNFDESTQGGVKVIKAGLNEGSHTFAREAEKGIARGAARAGRSMGYALEVAGIKMSMSVLQAYALDDSPFGLAIRRIVNTQLDKIEAEANKLNAEAMKANAEARNEQDRILQMVRAGGIEAVRTQSSAPSSFGGGLGPSPVNDNLDGLNAQTINLTAQTVNVNGQTGPSGPVTTVMPTGALNPSILPAGGGPVDVPSAASVGATPGPWQKVGSSSFVSSKGANASMRTGDGYSQATAMTGPITKKRNLGTTRTENYIGREEGEPVNLNVTNIVDPNQIVTALGTREGRRELRNFIVADADEIRAVLGVA